MTELNDELLVAYVDGQLATAQSKAIERVLEEDEVAAERVAALRAANTHLETAFEAMIAGEPIPIPAVEADTGAQGSPLRRFGARLRRYGAFAWVGFGCLVAGAASGFMFYDRIAADPFETAAIAPPQPALPAPAPLITGSLPTTWVDDMVRAQTFLSPETFSFGLESEGNIDLTSFQISKTLGANFTVPDLSGQSLTFQRAQMLQREGKPFAQIAYIAETGNPVVLYATARNGDAEAMKLGDKDGVSFATWTQGDLTLLLAGDLPDLRLGVIAREIENIFASAQPRAQDTGTPIIAPVTEGTDTPGAEDGADDSAAPSNQ